MDLAFSYVKKIKYNKTPNSPCKPFFKIGSGPASPRKFTLNPLQARSEHL